MTQSTRVAVIDDHPLFLQGIKRCLRMVDDFEIVAVGDTAAAACRIAVHDRPDIMLLDIGIPGNGIKALQTIRRAAPGVRVVMLTGSIDQEHIDETMELGACGYVMKGTNAEQLAAALRAVMRGELFISPSPSAKQRLQPTIETPLSSTTETAAALNSREQQILDLACEGLTNQEISDKINMPLRTIKYHLSTIFDKLGVRNRLEAMVAFKKHHT